MKRLALQHHHTRERDRQQDPSSDHLLRQSGQPPLKRCWRRLRGRGQRFDLPQLRGRARGADERAAMAARQPRTGVEHREALSQRRLLADWIELFRDRQRLACQRRLVDLQRARLDNPGISRDPLARSNDDQVTRHDLLGRDLALDAVAQHDGGLRERFRERDYRPFCSQLVPEAQRRVQDEHRRDRRCFNRVADQDRDHGRRDQQCDQWVEHLVEDKPEILGSPHGSWPIRTMAHKPLGGHRSHEAAFEVAVERARHFLDGARMGLADRSAHRSLSSAVTSVHGGARTSDAAHCPLPVLESGLTRLPQVPERGASTRWTRSTSRFE